jgi:DNA-binding CsgD family transcriptional regulator
MKERKKSKNLLKDVLYPIPERRQNSTKHILDNEATSNHPLLMVGPIAYFLYDFSIDRFIEMDDSIVEITGISKETFMSGIPGETLSSIVEQSHSEALPMLIQSSFELLEEYGRDNNDDHLIANIEHNITTKDGKNKRIIAQYIPVVKDDNGKPCINKGCIVDISHIRNDGLPQLFIVRNNKVIKTVTASADSIIKNGEIPLSRVELRIIQLISEGLLAKEVAREMNISISTLYTHRKNIKSKTGYDINKLISILKEKGLLVQTAAMQLMGEILDSTLLLLY